MTLTQKRLLILAVRSVLNLLLGGTLFGGNVL